VHNIRIRPAKGWQLYFQNSFVRGVAPQLVSILPVGVSLKGMTATWPPKCVVLQDNIEFDARISFYRARPARNCAHVIFTDTTPNQPYHYIMSNDELQLFLNGVKAGKIPINPDGFDVRLTFVKKGTQLFAKPIF
jgi:hypothetical protein